MTKKLLLLISLLGNIAFAQNNHYNMKVLAHYNDTSIHHVDGDQIWSDVMGWKDTVKNREYMFAGSPDSLFFFDITDPAHMVKCDVEFGHSRNAINRDYDVYEHYAYCVSDRTSPLGSLQIFDLQYLPDSVHKVYDNDTFSVNSHTIFIEAKSKRLYLCGNTHKPSGIRSMAILSLDNPEVPTFLGELNMNTACPYVHEVFVQNDTAYCSCGNQYAGFQGLYIYDLRDPQQTILLSSINNNYPGKGYNHSSWLDSTGQYLMFTDENQGSPIKVYDMKQFGSPDLVTYFNSHTNALPHNAYWKGRFAYSSMYEDGVYVFDMQNVANMSPNNTPPIVAFYDTYPKNATGVYNGFHGCWGVWPFLPSGVILASDISEGLFVLKPEWTLGNAEIQTTLLQVSFYPNPFQSQATLSLQSLNAETILVTINDLQGRKLLEQSAKLIVGANTIDISNLDVLSDGLYQLNIKGEFGSVSKPILKIK